MSVQSTAIRTLLAADATLVALLTGGIHEYSAISRNGIDEISLPDAWNNGILRPTGVVRARQEQRWGGLYDHGRRVKSVRNIVEVYVVKDGDGGTTSIDSAAERIEYLLDGVFAGGGWVKIINRIDQERIPDLNMAIFNLLEFEIVKVKQLV